MRAGGHYSLFIIINFPLKTTNHKPQNHSDLFTVALEVSEALSNLTSSSGSQFRESLAPGEATAIIKLAQTISC